RPERLGAERTDEDSGVRHASTHRSRDSAGVGARTRSGTVRAVVAPAGGGTPAGFVGYTPAAPHRGTRRPPSRGARSLAWKPDAGICSMPSVRLGIDLRPRHRGAGRDHVP